MKKALLGGLLLVAACSDLAGPENRQLELGTIVLGGNARIEAPTQVGAGESFEVVVYTYGSSCYSFGKTEAMSGIREAVIRPFDWVEQTEGGLCFMELREFAHTVEVTFNLPGTGVIQVQGLDRTTPGQADTVWVERAVEVLP